MKLSYEQIKEQAAKLNFKSQAFINGQYINAISEKVFACINPATGKKIIDVAACDAADINLAVKAARSAFNNGSWSQIGPAHRKKVLLKFAEKIAEHADELAIMETLNMGKPIKNSTEDVKNSLQRIRWYAELIDKVYDQIAPTAPDIIAMITREPVGVVGAITPWNYPLYLVCCKIAPALAVGNSLVIKVAEQSPLTALFIAQLASEAGIPDGVLNIIPGFGETAGKALALHNDVDAISFTGSTEVGKLILKYSADSNMKQVHLECGGKSPNIVLADCHNLRKIAAASIQGVFINQGEVCCAPTRLLVAKPLQQALVEKLIDESRKFQPNDPLHPETTMGPIVDQTQLSRVLDYINMGKKEGAQLVLGGNQIKQETGGFFIEPTIFDCVKNNMTIAREEIFGPVLSVISFESEDEAIAIANDTAYGLAASIWTENINKAHKLAKALRAGVVSVNCIDSGDVTTPFGGYKQSGIGRESSVHGLELYTQLKTTWIELQ